MFNTAHMELFAVMDDSMVWRGRLYVYAHALIVVEELPQVLVFSGGKREVYTHEDEIKRFITRNVNGHDFYACEHYMRYQTIWPLVRDVAKRVRGPVKKLSSMLTTPPRMPPRRRWLLSWKAMLFNIRLFIY
jgi:hypothetical protein